MMNKEFFLAGELAKAVGVSTDTLRHYESKGVLARPRRSAKGYRHYPADSLDRVRLVRSALAVGFTLDELARILGECDRGNAPCRKVYGLAVKKFAETEERLRELLALRDRLSAIVKDWDGRLSESSEDVPVRLLETLSASPEKPEGKKSSFAKINSKQKNKRKNQYES